MGASRDGGGRGCRARRPRPLPRLSRAGRGRVAVTSRGAILRRWRLRGSRRPRRSPVRPHRSVSRFLTHTHPPGIKSCLRARALPPQRVGGGVEGAGSRAGAVGVWPGTAEEMMADGGRFVGSMAEGGTARREGRQAAFGRLSPPPHRRGCAAGRGSCPQKPFSGGGGVLRGLLALYPLWAAIKGCWQEPGRC